MRFGHGSQLGCAYKAVLIFVKMFDQIEGIVGTFYQAHRVWLRKGAYEDEKKFMIYSKAFFKFKVTVQFLLP